MWKHSAESTFPRLKKKKKDLFRILFWFAIDIYSIGVMQRRRRKSEKMGKERERDGKWKNDFCLGTRDTNDIFLYNSIIFTFNILRPTFHLKIFRREILCFSFLTAVQLFRLDFLFFFFLRRLLF